MDSYAPYRTLQPGEMLNWYRIERILGRGGFGVIYLATDTNLDHLVAIKEYIPGDVATRTSDSHVHPITKDHSELFQWGMERFIKEARNLVKFKHPNIVRVMSVFQENNTAYMVMEFEEGEDLRSYLRKPGATSERSLKQLILPISQGLAEVHRHGFIHRDIKPANILVRKDGSPVLLDFGSARSASKFTEESLTALVSVGYAPLEQYNSESDDQQGPWTDIYALGGTLYYAISGKDPVESTRRGAAVLNGGADPLIPATYLGEGKYSGGFLKAIDWAMQFGIADRPQTLSDWIPALLADEFQVDTGFAPGSDDPLSAIAAVRPGGRAQSWDGLSDATVLSRNRHSQIDVSSLKPTKPDTSLSIPPKLRKLSLIALLSALVAVGIWYVSDQNDNNTNTPVAANNLSGNNVAAESTTEQAERLALAENIRQQAVRDAEQNKVELERQQALQDEQDEQEKLLAVSQSQQQAQNDAAAAQAAEKARLEAEALAAEALLVKKADDEAAAAEAVKLAAENAKASALAAKDLARAQAEAKAEQEREAERIAQQAARQARARAERRLKQAIGAAQNSISVGDLSAAQRQLENAQSIDADDARVQTLAFALSAAQNEYNRPVSDTDFDVVTRMFDALRRTIESKDPVALDQLAEPSQQSTIFKSLMKNFERVEVSIAGIHVRNADKSITGTLRIDSLVRANGDRGTLSDQYTTRTITSRRVNGGWSKIEW